MVRLIANGETCVKGSKEHLTCKLDEALLVLSSTTTAPDLIEPGPADHRTAHQLLAKKLLWLIVGQRRPTTIGANPIPLTHPFNRKEAQAKIKEHGGLPDSN